jgi:gamma-glutamyltranspeptidase / glutathione hydrolase
MCTYFGWGGESGRAGSARRRVRCYGSAVLGARPRLGSAFVLLGGAVLALAPAPLPAAPSVANRGVASESRLATDAGFALLEAGGSAADAAVAAALVAGVVSPSSSGLGGGGFALVRTAADGRVVALDFREVAPAVLDVAAFERRPLPAAERGKLVGVPGEAAGLHELSRRFGKKPWAELVEPARKLAADGFSVEPHLASVLADSDNADYRRMPSIDQIYFGGGKPARLGQRVKNPRLAATLGRLAAEGPRALYEGAIPEDLARAARQAGGSLTAADFRGYRVKERVPLRFEWEGQEFFSMPPPSAGGLFLAEVLGTFGRAELQRLGLKTAVGVHALAETMRGATADRSLFVGDPDALPIDVSPLFSPARLAARKARIDLERTRPVRAQIAEDRGTHFLAVADAEGNVVALTTTVNSAFGTELEGETSGIVLNDQLDDFTSLKTSSGLDVRFPPNRPRARVRPVSSMTPTIVVERGRPKLVIGASGGLAIPPAVTEVLLALLVHKKSPAEALLLPRFRPRTAPTETLFVEKAFPAALRKELERRGELVHESATKSAVQLLWFTERGLVGAADPRKSGVARVR